MRTLHRDLLLPCAFLKDNNEGVQPENSPVQRPRTRQQRREADPSTDIAAEDCEDPETLEPYHLSPPTVHFTVERQHSIPVLDPPAVSEDQQLPVSEHPGEAEDKREPTPSFSSAPASIETSSEHSDVEGNEPETEDQPENQNNDLPENLPEEILTKDPAEESNPVKPSDSDSDVADLTLRRSQRQRAQPQRLQYPTVGNPLISVVQTMLHSLSDALGINASADIHLSSVHEV